MEGCKEAKEIAVSRLTPRCASVMLPVGSGQAPHVLGAAEFVFCSLQIPRLLRLAGEFPSINLIK